MLQSTWFTNAILIFIAYYSNDANAARHYGFQNRIVGGTETTIAQVPYLINLRLQERFICGGSLVTPRCVLSAAHCVHGTSPSALRIQAGASKLSETAPIKRSVAAHYTSPFFSFETLDMDVAILRLNEPITSGPVSTIDLCNGSPADNSYVKISGWGITREDAREPADQVRTTNVRVVPKWECRRDYLGKAKLTTTMFCATVPGLRDSCSGDSGGPVVQNGQVCGIVSWGFGCARAEYPGVYTNVASLRVKRFIQQILREHCDA